MSRYVFPILLMIYEFVLYMSNDMYVPFFPFIANEFRVGDEAVSQTLSSWLLGAATAQLILGPLCDRFGQRIVLISGGILFIISCLLCVFSTSVVIMTGARFVQGIGVCSMMIAGYSCIHETYKDREAIKILTMMSSISIVAPMIGPVIGGCLAISYNWRIVFWILLICAGILVILLYFHMPHKPIKLISPLNIKLIATNYIKLLKNFLFICNSLCFSMGYTCIMLWISVSPFLLMQSYGLNSYQFGLLQIPIFGAFMLGTRIINYILNKFSLNQAVKYGFYIIITGLALLALCYYFNSLQLLIISIAVCMTGFGMLSAPLNRIAFNSSEGDKGITASIFYTCMMGLGAAVTKIFGYVEYNIFNFMVIFIIIALIQMLLFTIASIYRKSLISI